jgi:hypothetical protein
MPLRIRDDETKMRPQHPRALRVAATHDHLRRRPSSTMHDGIACVVPWHLAMRRSQRAPFYDSDRLLERALRSPRVGVSVERMIHARALDGPQSFF